MSDLRQPGPGPVTRSTPTRGTTPGGGGGPTGSTFLRRLHSHAPNSAQLVGFLTLHHLRHHSSPTHWSHSHRHVLLSSPIWVPTGTVLFMAIAGSLSVFSLGVACLAGLSWVYKYVRGWHPPGSDRVDYARSRIANTANHVKDCAKEYSGYLQNKVKDAAPGA
ncbi:oleosin II [Cinnamomum micranthum f. kanehirae]|uniref:Oleosin II n=1 Tax=Cinnamomum micranthum f. kanehirae TaxID=337451 RepID=A0A443NTZ9_9MAGN|nr:oleosin II [Cinnamomum micranthum f. kanehirae]